MDMCSAFLAPSGDDGRVGACTGKVVVADGGVRGDESLEEEDGWDDEGERPGMVVGRRW